MEKNNIVDMAHQMLHGSGSQLNTGNRWFDKTMQFIISEDGNSGLNYEHSASEGIAVIQLTEHLFKYMERKNKRKMSRTPSMCELPLPRRLKWKLSEKTKANISIAKELIDESIESFDLFILNYTKFGKNFPKKFKMSPDSFIQLSLQLAYYK
jgi:vacuolar-type H+-ATPase subunit F/Vma7